MEPDLDDVGSLARAEAARERATSSTTPRQESGGVTADGDFSVIREGFHSHGGTPIARWYLDGLSWKIHFLC